MAIQQELWGAETSKAVENFKISGERVPAPVVHWLGRIKAAAARTNAELGLLDDDIAERIAAAGDEIAQGEHDDQFPIDVFQTGSGTSSNMNANEVIATLAGDDAHPNDHVNMGQSSNDVFPSAVHLAALGEVTRDLLPAMDGLASALERRAGWERSAFAARWSASARSPWEGRRRAPGSTPTPSSLSAFAAGSPRTRDWRSPSRSTASRRREIATPWWSS